MAPPILTPVLPMVPDGQDSMGCTEDRVVNRLFHRKAAAVGMCTADDFFWRNQPEGLQGPGPRGHRSELPGREAIV